MREKTKMGALPVNQASGASEDIRGRKAPPFDLRSTPLRNYRESVAGVAKRQ